MSLKQDLAKHAASDCATYDADGQCLLDRPCVFFEDTKEIPRCPYFENLVLPGNEALHTRYWQTYMPADNLPFCDKCGQPYERKSGRQKYCSPCGAKAKRERKKRYNHDYYLRTKKQA